MEKEQNPKSEEKIKKKMESTDILDNEEKLTEKEVKITPENKIKELEEKITRTLAEMENQRRRFEKEKNDAFEYGGFSFARESLNLIDNLDLSRLSNKFNDSLAKAKPPYSKASSFSFSNLLR